MKIDKNIPIPEINQKSITRPRDEFFALLPEMEVGDSILVENRSMFTVKQWLKGLDNPYIRKKYPLEGFKLTDNDFLVQLSVDEESRQRNGIRVWRIK